MRSRFFKIAKWSAIAAVSIGLLVVAINETWVLTHPITPDETTVAGAFKNLVLSQGKEDTTDFYKFTTPEYKFYNSAGIWPGIWSLKINPDIDPRRDISFRDGKAYVRSWVQFPQGGRGRIVLEFVKPGKVKNVRIRTWMESDRAQYGDPDSPDWETHWYYTGKYTAELPGSHHTLKSIWARLKSFF